MQSDSHAAHSAHQAETKHLARIVERLIYGCLRDASSLLDAQNAQNALHDGLIARLI
jgi:hypothetical protein